MSKIKRLLQSYTDYVAIPWRDDAAAAQRVVFCVYNESEERHLHVKLDEFEIATRSKNHEWCHYDLTDSFSIWLSSQRYAKKYFENPPLLKTLLPKYMDYIAEHFQIFIDSKNAGNNTVVALSGVGSLFGFLKVKDVVDRLAPMVSGRLVVFFPGSYENNNYRLLDGYDGWNYLAVPITSDK